MQERAFSAVEAQRGAPLLHKSILGVAALGAAGLFLHYEHTLAGTWGLPLDDSWIHQQFARNLSSGRGFALNPGEPISASTAPLWTLALALFYRLPCDPTWTAKALGVLLLWASGLLTLRLARSLGLGGREALLGGLAVVLAPKLVWGSLSGMEVMLYTALSTAGIWRHIAGREGRPSYLSTVLFALAALSRPECSILFPLAVLDRWRLARSLSETVRLTWRHALLFGVLIAPFVAFNYHTLGRPLPNTFYAKVGPYGLLGAISNLDGVRIAKTIVLYPVLQAQDLIRFGAENNVLLTCLAPLGIVWILRDRKCSWLIPLVLVSFPALRGMLAPFKGAVFQHGRYAANLMPLLTVVGLLGLRSGLHLLKTGLKNDLHFERLRRRILWGAAGLILLNAGVLDLRYARTYGWNVDNINDVHVAMGRWLARNTPPEAVVATHDIGAIAYFSGRRVVDTTGLVTPAVLDFLRPGAPADEGVRDYLERIRPDYLVMLPNWYPRLAQMTDVFRPVHEIVVEHNTIVGGSRLVAYRAMWEKAERNER